MSHRFERINQTLNEYANEINNSTDEDQLNEILDQIYATMPGILDGIEFYSKNGKFENIKNNVLKLIDSITRIGLRRLYFPHSIRVIDCFIQCFMYIKLRNEDHKVILDCLSKNILHTNYLSSITYNKYTRTESRAKNIVSSLINENIKFQLKNTN